MKIFAKALVSGYIISILISFLGFSSNCDSVSRKVFRLHIIANSDSAEDQSLKLKVRDRVLNEIGVDLASANDIIEAEQIAEKNMEEIECIAEDEISKNGYNYKAKAEIVHMYFDTRYYGKITMPAGYYDALRVVIGEGKGKNWWCVMFPPMCLPAAQESGELEKVMNMQEVDMLDSGQKYVLEFKLVDWYVKLQEFIRKFAYDPIESFFDNIDMPYDAEFKIVELCSDITSENKLL